jgi:hypothetical protein
MDNTRIPFEAYKGTDPYIFVSYAHKDSDKVFPIIAEFHKAGFPIWYDEGIDPGNEWTDDIAKALQKCSLFIVFISASAVKSDNVRREINYALSKNKPFIHIWLEDASAILTQQYPGLEMQINSTQGIMRFRMEPENFYRKCLQSFDAFGIKRAKMQAEAETAGSSSSSGRASAALFGKILVDVYGEKTPLNQVAAISVPEAGLIVIQPWDKALVVEIEKALRGFGLSLNPSNDGKVIRVSVPPPPAE